MTFPAVKPRPSPAPASSTARRTRGDTLGSVVGMALGWVVLMALWQKGLWGYLLVIVVFAGAVWGALGASAALSALARYGLTPGGRGGAGRVAGLEPFGRCL